MVLHRPVELAALIGRVKFQYGTWGASGKSARLLYKLRKRLSKMTVKSRAALLLFAEKLVDGESANRTHRDLNSTSESSPTSLRRSAARA